MMFLKQIASVLLIVGFAVIGVPQAESAPLHIIGVIASDDDGNVPGNTIDQDFDTRWSARFEQWIRYQLKDCGPVGLVKIAWHRGNERTTPFEIEVWNESELPGDGEEWTPVHSGVSSGATTDFEAMEIPETFACFVRIVGYGNNKNGWNSITEVEIEGPAENEVDPDAPLPVSGVTARDFQDPNTPANTNDLDLNTRWSAKGDGQWIEFDLGEGKPMLNQVSIAWYQGDRRSFTFDIETSTDGENWTLTYGGYSSGTTLELQPHAFAATRARYVRIIGFGNSRNDWNSITEVEFRHVD
jgi:hypothetical protein